MSSKRGSPEVRSGGSFMFGKARASMRSTLLRKNNNNNNQQQQQQQAAGSDSGSSAGPLGRWLRDLRQPRTPQPTPPPQEGPNRSNPAYHSEGKGFRKRRKDRRRLSFNEKGDPGISSPQAPETSTDTPPATPTNGVPHGTDTSTTSVQQGVQPESQGPRALPMSRSTPDLQPGSLLSYLQPVDRAAIAVNTAPPPSRSDSTASLPASSSSGLSSWGSTQDASRAGWDQAPTPPVRDASSLKAVRYGPGHEKFPSWPVPAAADTLPAVRECCHATGGSHRSKSWTEHTDYPKENNAHYYTRPYMRRQASTGGASLTLKTVLERSEAAMMFAEPPPPRRRALPALDREGKPPNDLRYLAPSPPERDGPGQKAEPQVPHLTQAEVEEYARTYDAALLRQQSTEFLHAPQSSQLSQMSQGSYAHSEGYHSYVSSTDSTTTPFLDRLRQDSQGCSHGGWDDEAERDSEMSKWRGSLSDMSVSSSLGPPGIRGQLIAHSSRVQTPQRHMSESVLYLAPQQGTGSAWPSRVHRNNALNSRSQSSSRSPPPSQSLSVAERVNELERQSLSVSTSSLASSRSSRGDAATLRAIQKRALLSYYERQQQQAWRGEQWRSEPHLSPPAAPPRTSASECWRNRPEPQTATLSSRETSVDKLLSGDFDIRKSSSNISPNHSECSSTTPLHVREPSMSESMTKSSHHSREPSLTEYKHIREHSLTDNKILLLKEPNNIVMRRQSHSSSSSLSSSELPTSPIRKHMHEIEPTSPIRKQHRMLNGGSSPKTLPSPTDTSSDLLGPIVVGPSISLDDWVPERPPKKPHLRSTSFQQYPSSRRLVHSTSMVNPSMTSPPQPSPPTVSPPALSPPIPSLPSASVIHTPVSHPTSLNIPSAPVRRASSPDPPPPTPPPVLEDEVFHSDLPLPPPPSDLEQDWTSISDNRSGHTKSSTSTGHAHSYLRRNVEPPCSVEGSYKKTTDTSGDLIVPPIPAPRSLAPASATTVPVSTPITTVASRSAVVNSVAIGLAHAATKLTTKPNKLNLLSDCENKTINNNKNNNNHHNNNNHKQQQQQLPDVIRSTSISKNNNKTYLKELTDKKLSFNNNIINNSSNCDSNNIQQQQQQQHVVNKTTTSNNTVKSYVDLDCVATKLSALEIKEALPVNRSSSSSSSTTNHVPVSQTNGTSHSRETSLIGHDTSVKYTKSAITIQATETPLLFIESPSSDCSPLLSPTHDSNNGHQSQQYSAPTSPTMTEADRVTSDASSQTEEKTTVLPVPSDESRVTNTPSPTPSSVSSRAVQREEAECEQLSRDLASHLPPSDRLHTILVPVSEQKKVTDYVSGMFRLDIRATPRPSSRLANQIPSSGSCDQTTSNQNSACSGQNSPIDSPPPSPCRINGPTPSLDISGNSCKSNTSTSSTAVSAEPLPADSAYFTTSEPKAMFLTRYSECMSSPQIPASEDLQRKKEELMARLGGKLDVLRNEALVVAEESQSNETLGAELQARLRAADKPQEAAKLALHVEEVGKVTSLLLGLSGRLARAENALTGLPSCDEKRILEGKRDKLAEQLTEAGQLKASIDRRSSAVAALLTKTLGAEAAADFEHFVHMKASLQVEARELDDRVRLGEEQLGALRETLSS